MTCPLLLLGQLPDAPALPEEARTFLESPLGIAAIVLGAGVVVYFLAFMSGRFWASLFGAAPKSPEHNLLERVGEYPNPPGRPGPRQLTVEGVAVRVRLIVVAPVGKNRPIDAEGVNDLVNQVIRGMKEVIERDRPRVRIWPPQLSNTGFAPTFHRLTETPDADEEPSQWVLVAGPASAAGKPILLGMALLADEPNELGKLIVSPERWAETLRVQAINT
jgi:hypothetical protein